MEYGEDYWQEFQRRDETDTGAALTAARIEFVRRHHDGTLVDIGVGGGRFVREAGCVGYDINPLAVDWLRDRGSYSDPYSADVQAVTCWDSLEHMPDPKALLRNVTDWLFASIPVASSREAWLDSPHYKPGEHIWFWSTFGFVSWCWRWGFDVVEISDIEVKLGRRDIKTFAFRRFKNG